MHVLVIDGMKSTGDLWSGVLKALGGHVHCHHITDPEEALDWCAEYQADLLIVEDRLPHMDGVTFAKHLRLFPDHRRTPLLLLTDAVGAGAQALAIEAGASEVLAKPVRPGVLLQRSALWLKRHHHPVARHAARGNRHHAAFGRHLQLVQPAIANGYARP